MTEDILLLYPYLSIFSDIYFIISSYTYDKVVKILVTLSELQMKEVIMMHDGKKLGFIDDLEIDEKTGFIKAIIIIERQMKGTLFNKPLEKLIAWEQIVTIGADIILVNDQGEIQKQSIETNKIE